MKAITFKLTVTHRVESEQTHQLVLEDELLFPGHVDDETLGFDSDSFAELLFNLHLLAFCKGVGYGDSWKKRGEVRGCMANIDRKYDRISKSIDAITEHGHNDPSPRIDGAGDLAVYNLLYLSSLLKKLYPEPYKMWWEHDVQRFIDQYRPPNGK